jgi:hypothetical protein
MESEGRFGALILVYAVLMQLVATITRTRIVEWLTEIVDDLDSLQTRPRSTPFIRDRIRDKVILHHWVEVRFLTAHLSGNQLVSRCHSSALTLKVDDPNLFIMR